MSGVLSAVLSLSKGVSKGGWSFSSATVVVLVMFGLMMLGYVFALIGIELADRGRDGRQAPDAAAPLPLRWAVVRGMDRLGTVILLILASLVVVYFLSAARLSRAAQTECMQPPVAGIGPTKWSARL